MRPLRAMIGRMAAAVIVNSAATAGTLGRGASPVVVRDPIAPPALAAPPPRPLGDGRLTVGMIGRLAPWKGQDLFLRAFADALGATDARCVLVGAALFGEEAYERRLRALAGELGLAERIEFRGFRQDVWTELAGIDVLVHASRIPEPFGMVVAEGMAAGVAVIATDAGGPAEVIRHGIDGLLYAIGDQAALAGAIGELADDPARRERIAAAGAGAIVAAHDPAVLAARVHELYRDVRRRHEHGVNGGGRARSGRWSC